MNGGQTADSIRASESRRENVYNLLAAGGWHNTVAINSPEVGGSEGTRRLREIRRDLPTWSTIEKRKAQGSTTWEYRLVINGVPAGA